MIKVLGAKRIMMLFILVAVNVVLAATVYLFLIPQEVTKRNELNVLRNKTAGVRGDIDRMLVEFDQLALQQNRYEKLKERGFFYNQDRRQAQIVLESIQKQAGVVAAVANIQAGISEDNPEAQKAEYKVLRSPMKIHIEAFDPVDIYRYVYLLDNFFPGHIMIEDIRIERTGEVTGPVLRGIASGSNPVLVQADLNVTWRTMVPASEILDKAVIPGALQ